MTSPKLILTLPKRLFFFACLAIVGYFLTSVIAYFINVKFGVTTPAMRIVAILQDIFMMILPALLTSLMITRLPAEFLTLTARVSPKLVFLAAAVLIVSAPAMNRIIEWNSTLPLPDGIDAWLKAMEDTASATVSVLQGGHTVMDLVMSVLIIGIAAGFSEELFFRATFQRLLVTGRVNPHMAIWIVAVVFSALHLQFFGFVPRMLLGAFFGYLLLWSGSVWLPIIIHILNNTIYVVADYFTDGDADTSPIQTLGTGDTWPVALTSLVLTVLLIHIFIKTSRKQK